MIMVTLAGRRGFKFIAIIVCIFLSIQLIKCKKSNSRNLIEDVIDAKELKKLCRTKNNVLILFTKGTKESSELLNIFSKAAEEIKGQATLAIVDCSGEAKKLCRKLKISPEPHILKHYKDGDFHKDYDRKHTVQSMVNFLKDPSGDLPWEEDDRGKDVLHISDANILGRLLHREKMPIMVMFYAPWCGFCKRLKPEYEAAAAELKSQSILAAMDVNKPENAVVRQHFNITGFPTLLYFEAGQLKHKYDGENNKESIINFMKNPENQPEKPKEVEWSDTPSDVVHLTDDSFASVMEAESSVLVMFYAPWCGHCKKMKPEYTAAAASLKDQNIPGVLAAVDATKEKTLGERFKINGYPTVKYFVNGEFKFDVSLRTADKILEFMKDPKEPPPPPPPEVPWSEELSNVVHLTEEDFKPFLKRKKHVLLLFYAPWCGHCKKAKPEFQAAAEYFKDDPKVEFAALDCTAHSSVCSAYEVKGYPTIKYFSYYKVEKPYEGGRIEKDFVEYMKSAVDGTPLPTQPPPPSPEVWWSELPNGSHVKVLSEAAFEKEIGSKESALVMFYAPWCGHCKAMKPAFAEAAALLKEKNPNCLLAAVDATVENTLASRYSVKAFPTIKLFR
ncbi:protein disulfide-isomerase A5-like [Uloborus diversus]|uniref:protein disulfide-isomerase A5-like n=1 Tax=Uloborus diversus TaxID=327109 RepID=UPI002409A809|nr:protein disulfide-isomerase A5-like [Uloborus diversus]